MRELEVPLLECWQTVRLLGALIATECLLITFALAVTIYWWQRGRAEIAAELLAERGALAPPAPDRRRRLNSRLKHYAQRHRSREG